MPIINPKEAHYLLNLKKYYDVNNIKKLMSFTLPIASKNIYLNAHNMEIYEQFVHFLTNNYKKLLSLLNIKTESNNLIYSNNYYQYLYELIEQDSINTEDNSFFIHNNFDALEVLISNKYFSAYVSAISYSVICLQDTIDVHNCDKYLEFF